jgi:hypothetical protein
MSAGQHDREYLLLFKLGQHRPRIAFVCGNPSKDRSVIPQLDETDKPRVECSCLKDEHTVTPTRGPFRRRRSWRLCHLDSSNRGVTRDALRARALRGQGIVVHHKDVLIRGSRQEGKWAVIGIVILKDRMVENGSRRTRSGRGLSLG